MFRMIRRLVPIVAVVLANFILSTAYSKDAVMNNITTLCFGRFLIDLPADVHIKEMGQQSRFIYGDIHSEPYAGGTDGFIKQMKQREKDAYQGNNPNHYKFLEMKMTSVPNTRLFIFNKDVFGEKLYRVEVYHWDGDYLYSLAENSYEEKNIDDIIKGFETSVIARLRPRAQDEIPQEPGFCIKNGFIADDGSTKQFEEARMQINFEEWPDVWAAVFSQTVPKAGDDSLLERVNKHPYTTAQRLLVKNFRQGKHEVRGFKGEEILELLPTEEGIKQHVFRWEAMGAVDDIFLPRLVLEFETAHEPLKGPRPRSSLTDDQAIKLYDSIVNSIRLRPTTDPARNSQNEPPKTPLGELAATGRICPQSGWWQPDDPEATATGRQHFNAGDVLPKVMLGPKPGKWPSLNHQRASQQMSTVWRLVEYGNVVPAIVQQSPLPDADAIDNDAPSDGG